MRSRYKITQQDGIYFITSTIVEWLPVFTGQPYFDILIQSFSFCQQHKGLKLYGYVILDNHFHALVSGATLNRTIADMKKFTARQIIAQLQTEQKTWLLNQLAYYKKRYKTTSDHLVWQEGYHPVLLLSEKMLRQKLDYIHSVPYTPPT